MIDRNENSTNRNANIALHICCSILEKFPKMLRFEKQKDLALCILNWGTLQNVVQPLSVSSNSRLETIRNSTISKIVNELTLDPLTAVELISSLMNLQPILIPNHQQEHLNAFNNPSSSTNSPFAIARRHLALTFLVLFGESTKTKSNQGRLLWMTPFLDLLSRFLTEEKVVSIQKRLLLVNPL